MEPALAGFLIIGMIIGSIIGIIYIRAYCILKLWEWFIVPLFHLPLLTIPYALGISLFIGMFMLPMKFNDNEISDNFWKKYINVISTFISQPIFSLIFGWIIHHFFMQS